MVGDRGGPLGLAAWPNTRTSSSTTSSSSNSNSRALAEEVTKIYSYNFVCTSFITNLV